MKQMPLLEEKDFMSKIAFLYPGQGAQKAGMGADFYDIKSLKKEKLSKILLLELKKLGYIIN